jgi:cephalosporin hydroxylase
MSTFPPLYNTDGSSTCPLGLPMIQNRLAVPIWSYAMELYPPTRIIELGTAGGGFTTVIGVHAWRIGCEVVSWSREVAPDERFAPLARFLGIRFIQGDVFHWANVGQIAAEIQRPGVTFLLCDNGDKAREFNLFAPSLKLGDVIAAHDYSCAGQPMVKISTGEDRAWWPWSEITVEKVAETVKAEKLYPFLQSHFDMAGWLAYVKGK